LNLSLRFARKLLNEFLDREKLRISQALWERLEWRVEAFVRTYFGWF